MKLCYRSVQLLIHINTQQHGVGPVLVIRPVATCAKMPRKGSDCVAEGQQVQAGYVECKLLQASVAKCRQTPAGLTCAYFSNGCCCTRCSNSMPDSTGAARLLAVHSITVTVASSRCCLCCSTMPRMYSSSRGARLGGLYTLQEAGVVNVLVLVLLLPTVSTDACPPTPVEAAEKPPTRTRLAMPCPLGRLPPSRACLTSFPLLVIHLLLHLQI